MPKKGGMDSLQIKGRGWGLGKKEGGGVFEGGVDTPMCTMVTIIIFGLYEALYVNAQISCNMEINHWSQCRYSFNLFIKCYLCYYSQNVPSEAQVKICFFHRKVLFHSQDIQVFVSLTIP